MTKAIDTPSQGRNTASPTLYERDFHAWAVQQAALLRAGRLTDIDMDHLVEEIEGMSASERRELVNRLKELLLHLLKWCHQPDRRGTSWEISIANQRDGLHDLLEDSPSLRPLAAGMLAKAYGRAKRDAAKATGLPPARFPEFCPFTLEQVLDDGYWPD